MNMRAYWENAEKDTPISMMRAYTTSRETPAAKIQSARLRQKKQRTKRASKKKKRGSARRCTFSPVGRIAFSSVFCRTILVSYYRAGLTYFLFSF